MTDSASLPMPPPLWRRLLGFNVLSAVLLGVGGYFLGSWLGHRISGPSLDYVASTGENDIALALG